MPAELLERSIPTPTRPVGRKSASRRCSSHCSLPKFAILDELDSGLDVDALRAVAARVQAEVDAHSRVSASRSGVLAITHYCRDLAELRPDFVHVLVNGQIVESRRARARR